MSPNAVLISRIQFAFTIGYHILWPKRFHAKETEKEETKMFILITILLALIYVIAPKIGPLPPRRRRLPLGCLL